MSLLIFFYGRKQLLYQYILSNRDLYTLFCILFALPVINAADLKDHKSYPQLYLSITSKLMINKPWIYIYLLYYICTYIFFETIQFFLLSCNWVQNHHALLKLWLYTLMKNSELLHPKP